MNEGPGLGTAFWLQLTRDLRLAFRHIGQATQRLRTNNPAGNMRRHGIGLSVPLNDDSFFAVLQHSNLPRLTWVSECLDQYAKFLGIQFTPV